MRAITTDLGVAACIVKEERILLVKESRGEGIGLIDNFHVQKLNKDYALVKIKFLGKIDKIINELKDQNINLKMIQGQWQIDII